MFWVKYLLISGVMHLAENKVPYAPDSNRQCSDPDTYFDKRVKLCCTFCKPGSHAKIACSVNSDTECQKCKVGTYSDKPNYHRNCFKCQQCEEDVGLLYTRDCNASANAVCACRPGTYCSLREHKHCSECTELTACPPGEGVSEQGTDDSDVSCSPCLNGTFSDKTSYTETCQQHTDCESQGRNTLHSGSATSDRVCGPIIKVLATGPTTTTTTTTSRAGSTARTHTTSNSFTTTDTRTSVSSRKVGTPPHKDSVAIIVVVLPVAFLLAFLIVFLAVHLKRKSRGDTNNNIKETNKQDSFHVHPPEQQRLLGGKDSSNPSVSSSSSGGTDHRPLTYPEPGGHSVCHEPAVTVEIRTTIHCQLPLGTHLCPVPTSPVIDSTPSGGNLPLSKEEEQQGPTKEAQAAVQESGKLVC